MKGKLRMDKLKNILQKENVKNILILCLVSMFICLPLLSNKINIMYDDGIQHIARLIGTFQSIEEGQTFPVIMSKFCNNFGYSWNLFYSPLTAYLPLIFKLIGLSFIGCIKLFMFFAIFLSGITMYFFAKEVTKNNKVALIAGIFYIFAPYRLTDMYARNALAELTSFIFLPMIFHRIIWNSKAKNQKRVSTYIRSYSFNINTYSYYNVFCNYMLYILTYTNKETKKQRNNKKITNIFIIHYTNYKLLLCSFARTQIIC